MTFFVLGNEDVILGFQFIGIKGKIIDTQENALIEFNKVINEDYGDIGVLLITEKTSMMIEEKIMDWQVSGKYPLIVEIPDLDGHLEGKKSIIETIREAVGLHVWIVRDHNGNTSKWW